MQNFPEAPDWKKGDACAKKKTKKKKKKNRPCKKESSPVARVGRYMDLARCVLVQLAVGQGRLT